MKHHPSIHDDVFPWSALFDDGAAGSDVIMDALRSATAIKPLSVGFAGATNGGGEVVYATDNGWSEGPDIKGSVGSMVEITAEIKLSQAERHKALDAKITKTATYNSTSIDDSSSSASGGSWVYHITAWSASGGNARWQIVLEDSANNSAWATVGSESVNITAVGGDLRTFTGTLRRYVRLTLTLDASTGSITAFAAYRRA